MREPAGALDANRRAIMNRDMYRAVSAAEAGGAGRSVGYKALVLFIARYSNNARSRRSRLVSSCLACLQRLESTSPL